MFFNSEKVKDMVNAMLGRADAGPGHVFVPAWREDWWYAELCAESKTAKGWVNPGGRRNEAWDLLCYAVGMCHSSRINAPKIDWTSPPSWAAEWDENDMVVAGETRPFERRERKARDFKALAEKLA